MGKETIELSISEKDQLRFMSAGIARYINALTELKDRYCNEGKYDLMKTYMDELHKYVEMQVEIEDAYTRATLYGVEE